MKRQLTAEEFRERLQELGLTYSECARLFDLNRRTIERYVHNQAKIPVVVTWALLGYELLEDVIGPA